MEILIIWCCITLSFFSRSLNFLSPLIATLGTRFIIACAPNCILNQRCCTNMIKQNIYHRYMLLFFFYSSNTRTHTHTEVYKWLSTTWHHINPLSPCQSVRLWLPRPSCCLCFSLIHSIVHTHTHAHTTPQPIQIHISIHHTYKLISQVSTGPKVTCCRGAWIH